jgi:hypothetical protein
LCLVFEILKILVHPISESAIILSRKGFIGLVAIYYLSAHPTPYAYVLLSKMKVLPLQR